MSLAIIGTIGAMSMLGGMHSYASASASQERSAIRSLLARLRARAMAEGVASGICLRSTTYEVFDMDGAARTTVMTGKIAPQAVIRGVPPCPGGITFAALSGTATPAIVSVTVDGMISEIAVHAEGGISI